MALLLNLCAALDMLALRNRSVQFLIITFRRIAFRQTF